MQLNGACFENIICHEGESIIVYIYARINAAENKLYSRKYVSKEKR